MKFDFKPDTHSLREHLPAFFRLTNPIIWNKRIKNLRQELNSSPFKAKLIGDYHWLELELSDEIDNISSSATHKKKIGADTIAALYFANMIINVHQRLTTGGKNILEGRIRDALKSDTGFSPLYLEMDVARNLLETGHEIEFPDIEGDAQCDLRFSNGRIEGEVECKSLSTDAGRKIHRKDFYRFIDSIGGVIEKRTLEGADEVIVITLKDRLPSNNESQEELITTTEKAILETTCNEVRGSFFKIIKEKFSSQFEISDMGTQRGFYNAITKVYGKDCHVSGAITPDATCLIVLRSYREDDHSAPQLKAIKKAASQLSGYCPGFIALQFDDIEPSDLTMRHIRRRAGILSYSLFKNDAYQHIAATYFSIYGGLAKSDGIFSTPAFGIPNPKSKFNINPHDYPVFLAHIPDEVFAEIVGAEMPKHSISNIPIESEY